MRKMIVSTAVLALTLGGIGGATAEHPTDPADSGQDRACFELVRARRGGGNGQEGRTLAAENVCDSNESQ